MTGMRPWFDTRNLDREQNNIILLYLYSYLSGKMSLRVFLFTLT
jgi:hypothetical protein